MLSPTPVSLFTDGGVILRNPSTLGGTAAWCLVDANGQRVQEGSCLIEVGWQGLDVITNNVTELLAAVLGLEALPEGEAIDWYTDSECTRRRLTDGILFNGVPDALRRRTLAMRERVARATLLGGHPNRAELVNGRRKDGLPCSVHNVHCDSACTALARRFLAAREVAVHA